MVYNHRQFMSWVTSAATGDRCLYHIGQMRVDQEDHPHLKTLGDHASFLSDLGAIVVTQKRVDDALYQYFAARSQARLAVPKALVTGKVEIRTIIALRTIRDRDADVSATIALRDGMSMAAPNAKAMIAAMTEAGLVATVGSHGIRLTEAGEAVLR